MAIELWEIRGIQNEGSEINGIEGYSIKSDSIETQWWEVWIGIEVNHQIGIGR